MILLDPQLHAFEAIVKTGTVHAAAKLLHLTQTAVTQRLRMLEQRMKTTLFIRSRRGMQLTTEGTPDSGRSILEKRLVEKAEIVTSQGILLYKRSDVYGVPKKLDSLIDTPHTDGDFIFIVMPLTKDNHDFTYAAWRGNKLGQLIHCI
jgi:predicted transcriptional regulator